MRMPDRQPGIPPPAGHGQGDAGSIEDGTAPGLSDPRLEALLGEVEGRIRALLSSSSEAREEDPGRAVADLRRGVAEIQAEHLRLARAETMESVGRLASGLAHEIKNPLTVILMGIEYLTRHMKSADPEVRTVLEEMDSAVKKTNAIVRGILDFSVSGQLNLRAEPPNGVIEEALAPLEAQFAAAGIRVVQDLHPGLPPVRIDREAFGRACGRILRTSLDRLRQTGGVLTVRTSLLQKRGGAAVDEGVVVIEIEDSGPPVPESQIGSVFDPFRPKKDREGKTGIGLAMIRESIGMQGGVMEARSGAEQGLKTVISLRAETG